MYWGDQETAHLTLTEVAVIAADDADMAAWCKPGCVSAWGPGEEFDPDTTARLLRG